MPGLGLGMLLEELGREKTPDAMPGHLLRLLIRIISGRGLRILPGLGLGMLLLLSNSGPSRRQSTPGREWTEDLASWRVDDIPSLVQLLLLEARRWKGKLPDGLLLLPIFYIPGCSGLSRRPVSFPILSENVGAGRGRERERGVRMLGRVEAGIGFMAAVLYGEGSGLWI